MIRRSPFWLALCALLLGMGVAFAGTASAHARLKTSEPVANATVAQAPAQITLTFTEETSPTKSGGSVTDASGATVSTGFKVDLNERTKMTIPLKPGLGPGAYTVQYNTFTDDDGGMVADHFVFTVGAAGTTGASVAPAATTAPTMASTTGATSTTGVASAATRGPSVTLVPAVNAPATGAGASTAASTGSSVPVAVWVLVALAVVGALAFGVRLVMAQRR